ncbi:TPA: hypothetical protein ACPWPG_001447 [Pseudomonas aeruginosa]
MNKANECTCPSGDGSLRWPCPAHPAVEQAGGDERAAFEAAFAAMGRPVCRADYDRDAYGTPFDDGGWTGWQARAALAQPSPTTDSRPAEWSSYDPTWVVDFIRDNSIFNADLIERMLEYATRPAGDVPQAEQAEAEAEAERPEVVAYFDRNYPSTGDAFIWSNYEGSPYEPLMTVSQHERIVGELRADRDSWAEQAEQRLADWDEMRKERDAALAEVERLRESKGDPAGSLEKCMKVMYERDEHAKRLEVALARVAELEKELAMARDAASKGDAARHAACGMEMEIEELRAELAELRARVVVVPDAANDRRKSAHYCRGWNACLDELARLNGMTVSEGLLRRIVTPALTSSDAQDRIGALEELRALLVSLAWPWDEQWWKPSTARRDMVKACALALAEIERLDRAAPAEGGDA